MSTAAVAPVSATPGVRTDRGLQALRSEDFFKILTTELQNQDPLQPSKTSDMINNVSQIRSIELNSQLSKTLEDLTRQQKTSGMSDLLGKWVSAQVVDAQGNAQLIQGVVTGVRFNDKGQALLELDSGQSVAAADVLRIASMDPTAQTAATKPATQPAASAPAAKGTGLKAILPWLSFHGSLSV